MVVAVIGSRNSGNTSVDDIIKYIPRGCDKIISGGAIGIDSLAKKASTKLGLEFKEIKPNYDLFGKIAPILRNDTIVNEADYIIAFWDYKSNGTRDALIKALKLDKQVKIVIIKN